MYEVKITEHFAAAHQLRNFKGRCEQLHGHNWKIEVFVKGKELAEDGTLVDFHDVKKATRKVMEVLDHAFLNDLEFFSEVNPSSENIARFIFLKVSEQLDTDRVKVSRVTAWESDTACASYFEE
ncbi:MAG TPA: 6-carboxytetrahydropterin synthase QueD [Desulfobacterales bacterium]|nr:6-carboxytetrahydropterin synthase QueD [Desulfobacterales bacterium]